MVVFQRQITKYALNLFFAILEDLWLVRLLITVKCLLHIINKVSLLTCTVNAQRLTNFA
jgi:hypothetical protein